MKSSKKRIKYSEDMMSKGIERSKNAKKLKHEFVRSMRKKGIGTREMYLFEWTKKALNAKADNKFCNEKYTGGLNKPVVPVLTKENYREAYKSEKAMKMLRLENIPFSSLHNKLVNKKNTSTAERILKAKQLQEEHDKLVNDITLKRATVVNKPKKCGQVPFMIKIVCENSKKVLTDYETIPIDDKYRNVLKTASILNKEFSKKRIDYHHLAVVDNKTKEVLSVYDRLAA